MGISATVVLTFCICLPILNVWTECPLLSSLHGLQTRSNSLNFVALSFSHLFCYFLECYMCLHVSMQLKLFLHVYSKLLVSFYIHIFFMKDFITSNNFSYIFCRFYLCFYSLVLHENLSNKKSNCTRTLNTVLIINDFLKRNLTTF